MYMKMRNHGTTILLVAALLIFAAPAMAEPPTPFVIDGHVCDFCGDPCNETWVRITNMDTSVRWDAENSSESNYYLLMLDSRNVSDSDVLRFDAQGCSQSNLTEHTVLQSEINNGGFELNITLTPTNIVINEFVANPGSGNDWVELYNPTGSDISLDGWALNDSLSTSSMKSLDGTINASGYRVFEVSDRLNTGSDTITLLNGTTVTDEVTYGTAAGNAPVPTTGKSTGRYPNGADTDNDGADFRVFDTPTRGAENVISEDITPPTVIGYAPTGTGAPVSTNITATFDEAINPDTLNNETVTVEHNGTAVNGNITYDASAKTITFDPAGNLNYSETYNTTITTGVQDIAGNNMSSDITWNFTTSSTDTIISIGNASGNVTIPIIIANAANVGSVHISITYNASVCLITDVANGTFDWTFANLEHNETGWVRIGAIHTEESGLCGSSVLANVTFRSNSTNGTSSLNMSVITLKDATPQCNEIPYIVQNGTYTAVLNGDVNGDGEVDIADAMYLAKHVLVKPGFEVIIVGAADVDGDGGIDIADAMYLAKHVLVKSGFEELR